MPRPYDGPKDLSRDKPAPTTLFRPDGAKTRFGVWARERRDRQSADAPFQGFAVPPTGLTRRAGVSSNVG
jgi:hypothetical protein